MQPLDPYTTLKTFITRERAMRQKVFRSKPDLLRQKLADCDRALEALDRLHPHDPSADSHQPDQPDQPTLFGDNHA